MPEIAAQRFPSSPPQQQSEASFFFPFNRNYWKCDTATTTQTYQKAEYDKAKHKHTHNITFLTHINIMILSPKQ